MSYIPIWNNKLFGQIIFQIPKASTIFNQNDPILAKSTVSPTLRVTQIHNFFDIPKQVLILHSPKY